MNDCTEVARSFIDVDTLARVDTIRGAFEGSEFELAAKEAEIYFDFAFMEPDSIIQNISTEQKGLVRVHCYMIESKSRNITQIIIARIGRIPASRPRSRKRVRNGNLIDNQHQNQFYAQNCQQLQYHPEFDCVHDAGLYDQPDVLLQHGGEVVIESVGPPLPSDSNSPPSRNDSISDYDEHIHHVARPNIHRGQIKELWYFLFCLCEDAETYSHIIRYKDLSNEVFTLLDREEVARMWGQFKGFPLMNYDNMARAIRNYYKTTRIITKGPGKHEYRFNLQVIDQMVNNM